MPLLLDPLEGRALLTGSSIAGALRNYLRRYDKFCKVIMLKCFSALRAGNPQAVKAWCS